MKKICVVGHFGFGRNLLNGQTIKTKIVTAEIEKQFGKDNVHLLDLAGGAKRIPSLLIAVPKMLRKCDNFVMMPVENGLRFLTPLLGFWNLFIKRKLHYVVIGGWLPQFLAQKKQIANGLKRFDGIYVETNTMKNALELQGFSNVYVMPNCKKLTVLAEGDLIYPSGAPYKLCTFSRVMKEKGIADAVNAVRAVNNAMGYQVFSLDIYGQVDSDQTEWFRALQEQFPEYVRYGGVVPFNKSVEVLKEYFALLFPTYYEGEGFAGTLIDAYSAGVPVIASDWKYNSELVNERTGYVYPTREQDALIDILRAVAAEPKMMLNKKRTCLQEAEKYSIDTVIQTLIKNLE